MNTDAAEAILLGHYAVSDKLKWRGSKRIPKNMEIQNGINLNDDDDNRSQVVQTYAVDELFARPLIDRYSNGNVILPP